MLTRPAGIEVLRKRLLALWYDSSGLLHTPFIFSENESVPSKVRR
jgi:hypothetical protein